MIQAIVLTGNQFPFPVAVRWPDAVAVALLPADTAGVVVDDVAVFQAADEDRQEVAADNPGEVVPLQAGVPVGVGLPVDPLPPDEMKEVTHGVVSAILEFPLIEEDL